MKKRDKPTSKKTDKNKEDHENQNIHDFDPSQFTTDIDADKITKKKEKVKKEDEGKSDEQEV